MARFAPRYLQARIKAALYAAASSGMLPIGLLLALCDLAGIVSYCASPAGRAATRGILRWVLPGLSDAQLRREVRSVLIRQYRIWPLFFAWARRHPADHFPLHGRERLDEALAVGRGVILCSAHVGSFPLLPTILAGNGYPVHVIYDPHPDGAGLTEPEIALAERMRGIWEAHGCGVLVRGGGLAAVDEILSRGEIVWTCVDVAGSVPVRVFGRPATAPSGLVRLAMARGIPMLPAAMQLDGRGEWLEMGPSLALSGEVGDAAAALAENVQRVQDCVSEFIRQRPRDAAEALRLLPGRWC